MLCVCFLYYFVLVFVRWIGRSCMILYLTLYEMIDIFASRTLKPFLFWIGDKVVVFYDG